MFLLGGALLGVLRRRRA
ncbi:hypothetical protein [Hydrogenophaga sp.]